MRYILLILSALGLGGITLVAQNCGVPIRRVAYCSNSTPAGPCYQELNLTQIQPVAGGYYAVTGFISCCGKSYQNFYFSGGTCYIAKLSDQFQNRLLEVAAVRPVLIASCAGRYEPFHPQPVLPAENWQWPAQKIFVDRPANFSR